MLPGLAAASCRVLYKLEGPESKGFQVGLTEEVMRALDCLSLEQVMAELMLSKLDCQKRRLSKYHGVRPREGEPWQAQFRLGEVELIGSYFVEDQAARAYDGFALTRAGGAGAHSRCVCCSASSASGGCMHSCVVGNMPWGADAGSVTLQGHEHQFRLHT